MLLPCQCSSQDLWHMWDFTQYQGTAFKEGEKQQNTQRDSMAIAFQKMQVGVQALQGRKQMRDTENRFLEN